MCLCLKQNSKPMFRLMFCGKGVLFCVASAVCTRHRCSIVDNCSIIDDVTFLVSVSNDYGSGDDQSTGVREAAGGGQQ